MKQRNYTDELWDLSHKKRCLISAAGDFLESHIFDGKISEKDAAEYEAMEKEIDEVAKTIDYLERQSCKECLNVPVGMYDALPRLPKEFQLDSGEDYMMKKHDIYQTGDQYAKSFITAVRSNFKLVDEFLREGSDIDGGYLVPTEMNAEILQGLEEENVLRKLGTTINTQSQHKISIVASRPAATWIAEGQAINPGTETFGQISLDAYKLAVSLTISNELLQDSFYNLESFISEQFAQILGNAEEDSMINGGATSDTQNQPTGFLTTLASVTDSAVVTATSDTKIAADDILNLVYALGRPYRKKAVFIMHDSTLQQVRKLKDATQNYLWATSAINGEPDRLFGYPVYTSAYFPTVETSGDVAMAFGDFSRYYIGDRSVRTFRPLREAFALNDLTAFLMIERIDGILTDKQAIKILKIKS